MQSDSVGYQAKQLLNIQVTISFYTTETFVKTNWDFGIWEVWKSGVWGAGGGGGGAK